MDVFNLRNQVTGDYGRYVQSFLTVRDDRIRTKVNDALESGQLWPDPLIQLNPSFESGETLDELISGGELHPECMNIFRVKGDDGSAGPAFRLHRHQVEGVRAARAGDSYVLTTGTGSGKSLSYIVPIVDHVLRQGSGKGIQAIIVYPMNALANSQIGELEKFLCRGYPKGHPPVTFRRYTGQESDDDRKQIIASPPDILLTNYVMLEYLLTRPWDAQLITAAQGLRFLVLDELHTYRGRQGADVAMLVRRVKEACSATNMLSVGTSATLSSKGTWAEQQGEVAAIASRLFGTDVKPNRVIGETLIRATEAHDEHNKAFQAKLRDRLNSGWAGAEGDTAEFLSDPLSSWIETVLGLRPEEGTGRLIRCQPRSLTGDSGAAQLLAQHTGVPVDVCEKELKAALLRGYHCKDENGHPLFAFRLHQFVSKGDAVYASPEGEDQRHITLQAQQYVPGSDRTRVLLPIAFCRECGQEYYSVRKCIDRDGRTIYVSRQISDRLDNDDGESGFLYISDAEPWPDDAEDFIPKVPDAWLEMRNGVSRVRQHQRKNLPRKVFLSGEAVADEGNQVAWWLPTPFRFCLHCEVSYNARQTSDFGKLATLGSEGRSTATTVMTLSTIRKLRGDEELAQKARKLLSFTDNRQDASLQAGHFNDFVEIVLLRSAVWRAVEQAGEEGISHEQLTRKVFSALDLPVELYAVDPGVKYRARDETDRALREVLGYYLYRDLRRGWRVTSPNLEQCGLLKIDYASLGDFCMAADEWSDCHPALIQASGGERERVCRVLLDFLRRELAIRVTYLDPTEQETIRLLSGSRLAEPWSIDEMEKLETSRTVFPRSRGKDDNAPAHFTYLSPRGGFGLFLKRPGILPAWQENNGPLKLVDVEQILPELCEKLTIPGLLHRVRDPREEGDVGGYQVEAAGMIWQAGTGSQGFHDEIRVPNAPTDGHRTNPFFTDFYQQTSDDLKDLQAREHTAQVPSETREEREDAFREARLPILYCSPTMELGVDISQLNVVNMRNIPPTPANYAQRSGRAGRSGQPAFVFSYCSAGSPHDQYFFKRPEHMVAGSVTTPRLDLANEDLLRAHVHAIWLGASKLALGKSLLDVLEASGETPSLALKPNIQAALDNHSTRRVAKDAAVEGLGAAITQLVGPEGDANAWLDRVLAQVPGSFDKACNRWRGLYLSALQQSERQGKIKRDPSRGALDRKRAGRLRAEAEAQLTLLAAGGRSFQSDFYVYRYFASEGFLPGYNFPRLPLSAYLPGRQKKQGRDEFLTRPRFLAISEFGPRSFIYHEGSKYVINKVILPVEGDEASIKRRAVQCADCGYIHPLGDEDGPDLCENCNQSLPPVMDNLFRMQNVATRRRDRINSDEEERFRLGYELKSGVRFSEREGVRAARIAQVKTKDGKLLATLTYGHAATLWRMNLGWRRRKNKDQTGYVLDIERGYWSKSEAVQDDADDPMSPRVERVVPYVEDTRNCILVRPAADLELGQMASLEAALKTAIQMVFQLEDRELATEALPDADNRRHILLYEASEGGAGVLRRLVEDADALPEVARLALQLAHFDPDTLVDQQRAHGASEDCEAACYDCLLSYFNQRDHRLLDRLLLPELLGPWTQAQVEVSAAPIPRDELKTRLLNLCQSELEKKWLNLVDDLGHRLPSDGQKLVEACSVRPDFLYRDEGAAIFVDGPHHDTPKQKKIDDEQQDNLEDAGITVIRFHHAADWKGIFSRYPSVFGRPPSSPAVEPETTPDTTAGFDPEDFDAEWHTLLEALLGEHGCEIDPGDEVVHGGRVVGLTAFTVRHSGHELAVVAANDADAGRLEDALRAESNRWVRLSADTPDAITQILAGLGVDHEH